MTSPTVNESSDTAQETVNAHEGGGYGMEQEQQQQPEEEQEGGEEDDDDIDEGVEVVDEVEEGQEGEGGDAAQEGEGRPPRHSSSPPMIVFPEAELARLDDMINRPRWVIPVLPRGELEVLLNAAIALAKADAADERCEPCMRFYREGLNISFYKILTDDAANGWKFEIHRCIFRNCERLIELAYIKLQESNPCIPILDLLSLVLNPSNKFHTFNASRPSETVPPGSGLAQQQQTTPCCGVEDCAHAQQQQQQQQQQAKNSIFAKPYDARAPRGWLVDLINKFGALGGFEVLLKRFENASEHPLSLPVITALIRPFGQCYQFLTPAVIEKYFIPIVEIVPIFLEKLSDEELKRESKSSIEGCKNDSLSALMKSLKCLVSAVECLFDTSEMVRMLEMFRLKMLLRLLQISSFNGKMNALNEVNKAIAAVSFYSNSTQSSGGNAYCDSKSGPISDCGGSEWLSSQRLVEWIRDNGVLKIVLRDSLHQPQYVEKLEKMIRFMIKERALTLEDLDCLWEAQNGNRHEAIVKNMHDLLAKLAWDFTPEQLDHLFESCFQRSWATSASKKERERLLELIRRLAEDDKDGLMAQKVLHLLWNLTHDDSVPTDIMDVALSAHAKILDYSCCQDRDTQKIYWLDKCVQELKINEKWVLPALMQIREICSLYPEAPSQQPQQGGVPIANGSVGRHHVTQQQQQQSGVQGVACRIDIIKRLQQQHTLVILVTDSLVSYMEDAKKHAKEFTDPNVPRPGCRFSHKMNVNERLCFLKFLLKEGHLWLHMKQAEQIWSCLAVNGVYQSDRDSCFRWFSKLMSGDEPDLDPNICRAFFEDNFLLLDPTLLTDFGMKCFERFYRMVNLQSEALIPSPIKRHHQRQQPGNTAQNSPQGGGVQSPRGDIFGGSSCGGLLLAKLELIGADYLWKTVLCGSDEVSARATEIIRYTYTNLSPRLAASRREFYQDFIQCCMDRIRAPFDTLVLLKRQGSPDDDVNVVQETVRIRRVLRVLFEYVAYSNAEHPYERTMPPMIRAARGKPLLVTIRFGPNHQGRTEDFEYWSHTNETVASLKRVVLYRQKLTERTARVDFSVNGELLDSAIHDKKTIISVFPNFATEKVLFHAKLSQVLPSVSGNTPYARNTTLEQSQALLNSSDTSNSNSSSDSGGGSPTGSSGSPPPPPSISAGGATVAHRSPEGAEALPPDSDDNSPLYHAMREELKLPGVLIAQTPEYGEFLLELCTVPSLRDYSLRLLAIMPADQKTVERLRQLEDEKQLGEFLNQPASARLLYYLQVLYSLLMPARQLTHGGEFFEFQYRIVRWGALKHIYQILCNPPETLDPVDTRRSIFVLLLKIYKLLLTASAMAYHRERGSDEGAQCAALQCVPSPGHDSVLRAIALRLSATFHDHNVPCPQLSVAELEKSVSALKNLSWSASLGRVDLAGKSHEILNDYRHTLGKVGPLLHPEDVDICRDCLEVMTISLSLHTMMNGNDNDPWSLGKELLSDSDFVLDVLLLCNDIDVRLSVEEQLALMATRCHTNRVVCSNPERWQRILYDFVELLFQHLETAVVTNASRSREYFGLICRLLSYWSQALAMVSAEYSAPFVQKLHAHLATQVARLRKTRDSFLADPSLPLGTVSTIQSIFYANTVNSASHPDSGQTDQGVSQNRTSNQTLETFSVTSPDSACLLEGHLCITRDLVAFLTIEEKALLGKELIKELLEDFAFPASRVHCRLHKTVSNTGSGGSTTTTNNTAESGHNVVTSERSSWTVFASSLNPQAAHDGVDLSGEDAATNAMTLEKAVPICSNGESLGAVFDLLVVLAHGCPDNMKLLTGMLIEMFYEPEALPVITEWEYLPPIGPRSPKGFVGLKNAGATCYMNSVLQQLYMIDSIRYPILSVQSDSNSLFSDSEDYNLGVLKHVQIIFSFLEKSCLQYHVPLGFWSHFKLWGEPVNVREQHDALEFFNSLVDSIDEALKSLGRPSILTQVLGGTFADQKICKGCPHRYSREESFTTLNIDIRNHSHLRDSLEQYVRGDLLEGANAYKCERCNKKVDTVKRLCIQRLPPVLAIQLKRFDYDWEREAPVKFNDYFEFSRHLDMEPYTVHGLAKQEGEVITADAECQPDACTKYQLSGIVVHSGQASGGHYYSYIKRHNKWYKFDDGEVSECRMDDDEEMKVQCFGGEYMGEVFDHAIKRMSIRRQKRWWNAYILFYTRLDHEEKQNALDRPVVARLPLAIERAVWLQNIRFVHLHNHFMPQYYQFMRKLIACNAPCVARGHHVDATTSQMAQYYGPLAIKAFAQPERQNDRQLLAWLHVKMATHFLFPIGFHTKKTVRGNPLDWYECIAAYLRWSESARKWFATNALLPQGRMREYLFECPTPEVRACFARIVVFTAHYALRSSGTSLTEENAFWTFQQQQQQRPPSTTYPGLRAMITGGGAITTTSTTLEAGDSTVSALAPAYDPAIIVAGSPTRAVAAATLADDILWAALHLLRTDVSEYGRHFSQYFSLFYLYANMGAEERYHLLKMNVAATLMQVALDEGPGKPIKYQYADLSKLYQAVSLLVRSCDVAHLTQPLDQSVDPLPNPYGLTQPDGTYLMALQQHVEELLYSKPNYLKKMIEDANGCEETVRLVQFLCWENAPLSSTVLCELLWQIAYSCTHEISRTFGDLLLHVLAIGDSWQLRRIHNALKGVPEDRDGLFATIQRTKNHFQRRAYHCIKCLVSLFSQPYARDLLRQNGDIRRRFNDAVEWLHAELDQRGGHWSPTTAHSNESSNSYFLERSNSAILTLSKAHDLLEAESEIANGGIPQQTGDAGHRLGNNNNEDGSQQTEEWLSGRFGEMHCGSEGDHTGQLDD